MHRTCGEPDGIELTAMGVELNGPQVAAVVCLVLLVSGYIGKCRRGLHRQARHLMKRAATLFGMGVFLDFVRLATRTVHPHGAHVRGAKRSRIDRHGGVIVPPGRQAQQHHDTALPGVSAKRAVLFFKGVFSLISSGSPQC